MVWSKLNLTSAHVPVFDHEIQSYIDKTFAAMSWHTVRSFQYSVYDRAWRAWLESSSYNTVRGLDAFPHSCFCAGTTPVFGAFIARHHKRRIRVARDDFMITQILSKNHGVECLFLEEADLVSDDCMIMSVPFSANGDRHPAAETWLSQAEKLEIPVMIDGAYFGISHGIEFPLQYSCVKELAFSLSKNYAGNVLRLGIRFSRETIDDSLSAAQVGADLFDRMSAWVATALLEKYSHDWFVDRYRPYSDQVCAELGLVPTNTLTLALGGAEFDQFKRGDFNRVCISQRISQVSCHS